MTPLEEDARKLLHMLDELTGGERIRIADDDPIVVEMEDLLQSLRERARN